MALYPKWRLSAYEKVVTESIRVIVSAALAKRVYAVVGEQAGRNPAFRQWLEEGENAESGAPPWRRERHFMKLATEVLGTTAAIKALAPEQIEAVFSAIEVVIRGVIASLWPGE